ncbi:4096_t:CDS:2, partial [Acaulospora morrowiae]
MSGELSGYDKGLKFENEIYSILKKNISFTVNLTRSIQGDGGIDLILFYKDMLVLIQCKNLASRVGVTHVKEFITTFEMNKTEKKMGLLISANGFSKNCYDLLHNHNIILLTDKDSISDCIISYYRNANYEISNTSDGREVRADLKLDINRIKLDVNCLAHRMGCYLRNFKMTDFNNIIEYSDEMMKKHLVFLDDLRLARKNKEKIGLLLNAYKLVDESLYKDRGEVQEQFDRVDIELRELELKNSAIEKNTMFTAFCILIDDDKNVWMNLRDNEYRVPGGYLRMRSDGVYEKFEECVIREVEDKTGIIMPHKNLRKIMEVKYFLMDDVLNVCNIFLACVHETLDGWMSFNYREINNLEYPLIFPLRMVRSFDFIGSSIANICKKNPKIIIITGAIAVGKTTFARELSNYLTEKGKHVMLRGEVARNLEGELRLFQHNQDIYPFFFQYAMINAYFFEMNEIKRLGQDYDYIILDRSYLDTFIFTKATIPDGDGKLLNILDQRLGRIEFLFEVKKVFYLKPSMDNMLRCYEIRKSEDEIDGVDSSDND